jgi:hypothetical protein
VKVFIVLSLLFPGEYTFEEIKQIEVGTFANCRAVSRELRRTLKAPEGFQYVTHCYDADTSAEPATPGWLRQNYDKDPTRIKKKED